jgi:hypothetical protein
MWNRVTIIDNKPPQVMAGIFPDQRSGILRRIGLSSTLSNLSVACCLAAVFLIWFLNKIVMAKISSNTTPLKIYFHTFFFIET